MAVQDRQRRRAEELRAGRVPQTSDEGHRVNATVAKQSYPIRDVPLGPGGGPGVDAPLNAEMLNQQADAAQAISATGAPVQPIDLMTIPDAKTAMRIATIANDQGREGMGDADYERAILMLKNFEKANPGVAQAFRENEAINKWYDDNLDVTPHRSSRVQNAQGAAIRQRPVGTARGPGRINTDVGFIPQTIADLDPVPGDSREAVIDRLESEGVDTTSGAGGFWDNVGFAIKLNDSGAQAKAITGVAMDNLAEAGIVLPEGVRPITVNQDLGQLEVLMPTSDGKVRRTLVEPEVLNLASAGRLADLEELMAGVYAATATIRGGPSSKHPFVRELVGDFAGRNVGIMLESIISGLQGEADLQDMVNAFKFADNVTESGLNTLASRGLVRTGNLIGRGRKAFGDKFASGSETAEVINRNIDEAADIVEDVNALVGDGADVLPFTVETGSLSQKSAQNVNARVNTLNNTKADAIELTRRERVKTLAEANRRVAERHSPADGVAGYDPHDLAKDSAGTVNTARQVAVDAQRSKLGQVSVRTNPDTGLTRYSFRGEVDATTAGSGSQMGEHGIDVAFSDDAVHIVNAFAGEKFDGVTGKLFNEILAEAGDRPITLGDSVSASARKAVEGMRRRGWVIEQNPRASIDKKDGVMTAVSEDGFLEPVYTITARPGEIVAPKLIADATFDREVTEATVEGIEELLPIAQARTDDANFLLKQQIGWSEQTQRSNFYLENSRASGLSQQVRRLQAKVRTALTGVEASEADKALAIAVRRETTEDGDVLITGLYDDQLDIGNLLNSRAKLNQIAEATGDADMAAIVNTIDNLLKSKPYINKATNRARPAQTAGIRESYQRARQMSAEMDEISAVVDASKIFKRNADGELINTDLTAIGRVLANGSAFMQHMMPVIKRGPELATQTRGAIADLYRKEVLDSARGWSATSHKRFLDKYGVAIDALYGAEEQQIWKSFRPPSGEVLNRAQRANQIIETKFNRLVAKYAPDPETVKWTNPRDIVASVNTMGARKGGAFMDELKRLDPSLHASVQKQSIDQTRKNLHELFFDPNRDAGNLQTGVQMRKWFNDRKDALKALHGDQYVTDLETVVRGAELDAKRLVLRGSAPATQHDLIRVTRSILGPLSKPQRQISAGNYINNKRLAARVMDIYSDPDMLRALKQSKGVSVRSQAGIALFVRLGLAEAMGIPAPENVNRPDTWSPEFKAQISAAYEAIDFWSKDGEDEHLDETGN